MRITPQIRNINQDEGLSGAFKYPFKDGANVLGKSKNNQDYDIKVSGVGIGAPHCEITYDSNERVATLTPSQVDYQKFKVSVNGALVEEPVRLNHNDRILVASHFYYQYVDPMINAEELIDYESCVKEFATDLGSGFGNTEEFKK